MRPSSIAAAGASLWRVHCRQCHLSGTFSAPVFRPLPPNIRKFSVTPRRREEERQWSTPLAKQLFEAISTTGPVPLASYMRMCLTGDLGGYYTGAIGQERDQFGVKGDFVTSPEISQIFGELVGLWFIAEWISQGQPRQGMQLIEVGPGRGTLMDDMLRTIQRFPAMANSIESVYMVEASPELKKTQQRLLCSPEAECTTENSAQRGKGRRIEKAIVWVDSIKSVPAQADKIPFIVAHEFFDALPIHIFQSTLTRPKAKSKSGASTASSQDATEAPPTLEWREMMISPTSPAAIASAKAASPDVDQAKLPDEFQLILSSKPTRHSRYLPESSPRYRALRDTEGSVIEMCPDASLYAADFATRIGGSAQNPKSKGSGAALILDYGTSDTIPINSLRGIRQHKLVSPFCAPGLVDLSVDVDFTAIAEAATLASENVEVHGPVSQADFLELMGIRERAEMLAKSAGAGTAAAQNIEKSWKRLVDRGPNGMGKVYKALAILPENDGKRRPVGFGGDISRV